MKIAVTGPTGYIGSHFIEMARAKGHEIIFLSREQHHASPKCWIPYDLNNSTPPQLPSDVKIILHLAFQVGNSKNDLESARHILAAGKNVNARVIFLSSQTASKESITDYGRTKWEIEQLFNESENIIVRPGLVYGGNPKGLFSNLLDMLQNQKYIPSFLPSPKIQPIHIQDLCSCLIKTIELESSNTKIFFFGEELPISFTSFMQFLAKTYLNKEIKLIPIPTLFVLLFTITLKNKWPKASQLASLLTLPLMNTTHSLSEVDYQLRLCLTPQKLADYSCKKILLEGFIIYSYITRKKPILNSLRSYARLIQKNRKNLALKLPDFFSYLPLLLCTYDQSHIQNPWVKELNWRIHAASLLIEASPQGATELLKTNNSSFFMASSTISIIILKDITLRFLGVIVRPCLAMLPPKSWD
jgi:NADH dehydrogenase